MIDYYQPLPYNSNEERNENDENQILRVVHIIKLCEQEIALWIEKKFNPFVLMQSLKVKLQYAELLADDVGDPDLRDSMEEAFHYLIADLDADLDNLADTFLQFNSAWFIEQSKHIGE